MCVCVCLARLPPDAVDRTASTAYRFPSCRLGAAPAGRRTTLMADRSSRRLISVRICFILGHCRRRRCNSKTGGSWWMCVSRASVLDVTVSSR